MDQQSWWMSKPDCEQSIIQGIKHGYEGIKGTSVLLPWEMFGVLGESQWGHLAGKQFSLYTLRNANMSFHSLLFRPNWASKQTSCHSITICSWWLFLRGPQLLQESLHYVILSITLQGCLGSQLPWGIEKLQFEFTGGFQIIQCFGASVSWPSTYWQETYLQG